MREDFPRPSSVVLCQRDEPYHSESLSAHGGKVLVVGRTLSTIEELEVALPALVAEIRGRASRLRIDRLQPGQRYRVLRPFSGLAVGQFVTFAGSTRYSDEWGTRWRFFGGLVLDDNDPDDCVIIGAVHEYLALDSTT